MKPQEVVVMIMMSIWVRVIPTNQQPAIALRTLNQGHQLAMQMLGRRGVVRIASTLAFRITLLEMESCNESYYVREDHS
jgi:hypothetical protein